MSRQLLQPPSSPPSPSAKTMTGSRAGAGPAGQLLGQHRRSQRRCARVDHQAVDRPFAQHPQGRLAVAGGEHLDVVGRDGTRGCGRGARHPARPPASSAARGPGTSASRRAAGPPRPWSGWAWRRSPAPGQQGALAGLVGGDDADGDVARGEVVLEPVEHAPAVDVGQEDVQRQGVRLVLARQGQGGGAERGDQTLEALLAGRLQQDAGEAQVVLDDQQHAIARLDVVAVVADFVHHQPRRQRLLDGVPVRRLDAGRAGTGTHPVKALDRQDAGPTGRAGAVGRDGGDRRGRRLAAGAGHRLAGRARRVHLRQIQGERAALGRAD